MALDLRRGEPFTFDDLASFPDDGRRYELVDGALVVTPAPLFRHQLAVARLLVLLSSAAPPERFFVLAAPFDVRIGGATSLQPDVLVVPSSDRREEFLTTAPALVVEVLSPSTRRHDLVMKRALYADFGVGSYWVVDPDVPSVLVLELGPHGAYFETASSLGERQLEVTRPFPVAVTPSALVI